MSEFFTRASAHFPPSSFYLTFRALDHDEDDDDDDDNDDDDDDDDNIDDDDDTDDDDGKEISTPGS